MIAHDRRIAEKLPAIVSDYVETLFCGRAKVSDNIETLPSDRAIVGDRERSYTLQ